MLYVDTPTSREFDDLNLVQSDVCVSIYLKTTPVTHNIEKSRISLGNMVKEAIAQLEDANVDKRRIWPLQELFEELLSDTQFWAHQANSLAIFATPERIRTYRLANELVESVEVSDRFNLKPLLRAITFSHTAYVLAISENSVRLIEVSGTLPAVEVKVPDLPTDVLSALDQPSISDRASSDRIHGGGLHRVRLAQFARKVDAALRPILKHSDHPVVLAATQPIESTVRSVSTIPFLETSIAGNTEHLSEAELAQKARPVLDEHYKSKIEAFHDRFKQGTNANRTTTDISDAARAATFGAIDTLLVNIDSVIDGYVDEETGFVTFDEEGDAKNYGVVDEIARRALQTGANVMGVRRKDIPNQKELAAILRRPL